MHNDKLIHAGDILTDDTFGFSDIERPVAAPLYQTSLFTFPNVAALQRALQNETASHLYSRGNNPTVELVEQRIAALEGGEQAKLFSSGVAAIAASILSCVEQGDHILCSSDAYTWARYISGTYLKRFGVTVTYVNAEDLDAVEQAITKKTRLIYLESPGTLTLHVQNLRTLSALAKSYGITTIADNTWATPLYQNPLELGIDIVVHSASKYLGGHSDVIGGIAIGSKERIEKIFKTEFLPIGHVPDPFQAWLIQRGMRTLHVRLPYHYQAALEVCDFLHDHSKVAQVNYPMHPKSPWFSLASEQMRGGCGLLSFRVKTANREKIVTAIDAFSHFRIGVSWGGYESLVYPAAAAVDGDPSIIRLHIGLEETQTLLKDLDRVLSLL